MITWKDFLDKITLEELKLHYDEENRTLPEVCEYFGITQAMFIKILKYYNFHKSKESHTASIKKAKKEKYGDENYNNSAQTRKTCLEKYGVDNQFKREELQPVIKQRKIELYGDGAHRTKAVETRIRKYGSVENSYQAEVEHRRKTCLERYGVDSTCKIPEIKEKIAEGVKKTFLEKYGVENYWLTDDAKRSNGSKNSSYNLKFAALLAENSIEYESEVKIGNRYFDFKVGNTLIEINPSPTHNVNWSPFMDHGIDPNYHFEKTQLAIENGYRCIHIWDWDDQQKIINLLLPRETIYARKCQIVEIQKKECKEFLDKYHLQGYARSEINIGLKYNDELVSTMTFGKPRYSKKYDYELIRYCSSKNIIGGVEKLFKYFLDTYNSTSLVSYCDLGKFIGETYLKLGFTLKQNPSASKHWYNIETETHITDNLLRQRGFDQLFGTSFGKGTSNEELMIKAGFVEIYDAGQATYTWNK